MSDRANSLCKNGGKKEFSHYEYGYFLDCHYIVEVHFGGGITDPYMHINYSIKTYSDYINKYYHNYVDQINELQHFYVIQYEENKVGEGVIYLPCNIVGCIFMFEDLYNNKTWEKLNTSRLKKHDFLHFLEDHNLEIIYDEIQIERYKREFENKNATSIQKYITLRKERSKLKNEIRNLMNIIYDPNIYETETDSGSDDD